MSEKILDEKTEEVKRLDAGRTVRSGLAFDFDSTEPISQDNLERAEGIRELVGDDPVSPPDSFGYLFIKRLFDVFFSASVLLCLSWLFAIIAIVIKVEDPK